MLHARTSPRHNRGDNRIVASKLLASLLLEVHGGVTVFIVPLPRRHTPMDRLERRRRVHTQPYRSFEKRPRFVTHILCPAVWMGVWEEGDFQEHNRNVKGVVDLGVWGFTRRHVEWAQLYF